MSASGVSRTDGRESPSLAVEKYEKEEGNNHEGPLDLPRLVSATATVRLL